MLEQCEGFHFAKIRTNFNRSLLIEEKSFHICFSPCLWVVPFNKDNFWVWNKLNMIIHSKA